jgi:hypothetical protein
MIVPMATPKWLDRIILWAIAISFLIVLPAFVFIWAERAGWVNVGLFVFALFLIGVYKGLSSRRNGDLRSLHSSDPRQH